MAIGTNTGTYDIPLKFAKALTEIVHQEWESGALINKVTPTTASLLRYWFSDVFCDERGINFHEGQKQAILNAIYCHEILKTDSVTEMYAQVCQDSAESIVDADFILGIQKNKYSHPKYCIKMATGTGKTWVLNALLLWQYLNAKYSSNTEPVKFTKNFLLVAPGLIVYERLLDAFKGKQRESGFRDFDTSDIKRNESLFIPDKYRQQVYSFIQNNVVEKQEIGKKVTGEGVIAISNWHVLSGLEEEAEEDEVETAGFSFEQTRQMAQELLPISPGISAGHALENLDNKFLSGGELEYLANLPDICVFNDEAHHIHENKSGGVVTEVEWQKALNAISVDKHRNFIQIDFSATPYDVTGSGQRRAKHYFPHIIVDFTLTTAIRTGLVKTFVLDKRKELDSLENADIEFKAIREGKKVIGLSEGQRLMLRAGLSKLKILEEQFVNFTQDAQGHSNKHPKMLVICEDTKVSPHVVDFLVAEGLGHEDVMQIDSDRQGSVSAVEWAGIKQKLFNIDSHSKPKVVVSVLMLREGFDVSNVCVIVPLRSSEAPILLEQVLGRGLRLMWREPEYVDIKAENRRNIYELKKPPINYLDILTVIEHPAFEQFYEDLDKDIAISDTNETMDRESVLGDIVTVELKENYKDYDLFWPIIIQDREETMCNHDISIENLQNFTHWNLTQLKAMVTKDNDERFYSQEMSVRTTFGQYTVKGDLFTAQSYNEYLQKMLKTLSTNIAKVSERGKRAFPLLQINQTTLMGAIDRFIKTKLFGEPFNPLEGNNWRILMISGAGIVEHIVRELSNAVYQMQTDSDVNEAIVEKRYFSETSKLTMRENFSLDIKKSIYKRTGYPSNKGGLEKDFLLACDADGQVERLVKINENRHLFAKCQYLQLNGMLSSYYPDFMVKIEDNIYVVETKSEKDATGDLNVKQKKRGALHWVEKINELRPEDRMRAEWSYVLLSDASFYALHGKGASIKNILDIYALTEGGVEGVTMMTQW